MQKSIPKHRYLFVVVISCLAVQCNGDLGEPVQLGSPWIIFTRVSTSGSLACDTINDICVDASNTKWFATDRGASGLYRSSWSTLTKELEYSTGVANAFFSKVTTITSASDGSLWFGLGGGGVRRYAPVGAPKKWTSYTRANGLSENAVAASTLDIVGDLWFATSYGISKFHQPAWSSDGIWTTYLPGETPLPTSFITAINAEPKSGTIWIGTLYGDLIALDRVGRWIPYVAPKGASPITAIAFQDSNFARDQSLIWVGTYDGVFSFSQVIGWNQYTVNSTNGGLPSNIINAIVVDQDGTRWIGTEKGLVRFFRNTWTTFNRKNSPLPSNEVRALALDAKHNLWIGTTRGIGEYKEGGTR